MNESDDENGGFASPLDDNESLTGYESATDGNLRRKMEEVNNEGTVFKKQKMEAGTNKNGKKTKDKFKNKKDDANDGLFGDGWHKNKTFKTFIMEPKDDKSQLIHIMEIARILRNIKITYQNLVQAGRNRFKITFANPRHAEQLINSKIITEEFKYNIYVPTMYKETIGVVRNVPPSIPESELLANIDSERIRITRIERIKRLQKKELISTYSIKIYAEGEKLPRQIKIFDLPYEVDCYVFPMKCCVKCVRYGHTTKACKSPKVRCYNCSDEGHEGQDCTSLDVCCMHCKGNHKAFDPICRERGRQDNIRKAMAYNKLTFAEAAKLYPIPSQIQYRLQDNSDFPSLTQPESLTTHNMNDVTQRNPPTSIPITQSQPNNYNQLQTDNRNNTNKSTPTEYITKSELDKIVNQLKIEIVKQLNVTKLINKIKEIQETIVNNISIAKEGNGKEDNHQLLIKINKQLNDLINPEILKTTKPPDNKS